MALVMTLVMALVMALIPAMAETWVPELLSLLEWRKQALLLAEVLIMKKVT